MTDSEMNGSCMKWMSEQHTKEHMQQCGWQNFQSLVYLCGSLVVCHLTPYDIRNTFDKWVLVICRIAKSHLRKTVAEWRVNCVMWNLEAWAADWGMQFNASKCHVMSISRQVPQHRLHYMYQLCGVVLDTYNYIHTYIHTCMYVSCVLVCK